eukprot:g295.t1
MASAKEGKAAAAAKKPGKWVTDAASGDIRQNCNCCEMKILYQ